MNPKNDERQWMILPKNAAYPNFNEVHLKDDWCPKAGCVPVSDVRVVAGKTKVQHSQMREELEKEWLEQTEWQDFTNWLIHVKLRAKLSNKCTCDSIVGPHCTYAGHKIINESLTKISHLISKGENL